MRGQEMDMVECLRLLRDKARQFDRWYYEAIFGCIVRSKSSDHIRFYLSAPDEQLHSLFVEAKSLALAHGKQFQQFPPQKTPSSEPLPLVHWNRHFDSSGCLRGLQAPDLSVDQIISQKEYHVHTSSNFQGIQFPCLPSVQDSPQQQQFQPSGCLRGLQALDVSVDQIISQKEYHVHTSSNFQGIQFPCLPSVQDRPQQQQFQPSGYFQEIDSPFPLFDQVRPQHPHQFHPSRNFQGIQAPSPPIGPSSTGAFRCPYSEFIGLGQYSGSFSIPDNAMASNHQNKCEKVTGYPFSNFKVQRKRCELYFSSGCKRGLCCHHSHESDTHDRHNERQLRYLRSLHMVESEIRGLLLSQQSPVPIEHLHNMYLEVYHKPLKIDEFNIEDQLNGNNCYSLIALLLKLDTTRVIERQKQYYVILEDKASKYLDSLADGFTLVLSSYRIYITLDADSTFTEEDAYNYFSKYGPVEDVQILHGKYTIGFVHFPNFKTVKKILSERSPNIPHFISGRLVLAKLYYEKSEPSICKVSYLNDIHEHHTGEKTSSSHGLFQENLSSRHGLGVFTRNNSITVAPEMALQLTEMTPDDLMRVEASLKLYYEQKGQEVLHTF